MILIPLNQSSSLIDSLLIFSVNFYMDMTEVLAYVPANWSNNDSLDQFKLITQVRDWFIKRTEALNRETDNSQVQDWFLSHIVWFIKKNWVIKGTQLWIRLMLNVYLCLNKMFIFLPHKNYFHYTMFIL